MNINLSNIYTSPHSKSHAKSLVQIHIHLACNATLLEFPDLSDLVAYYVLCKYIHNPCAFTVILKKILVHIFVLAHRHDNFHKVRP